MAWMLSMSLFVWFDDDFVPVTMHFLSSPLPPLLAFIFRSSLIRSDKQIREKKGKKMALQQQKRMVHMLDSEARAERRQ